MIKCGSELTIKTGQTYHFTESGVPKMRKIRSVISLIALVFTLACAQATTAQQPREQPDKNIDAAARTEVIDGVLKKLNDAYVFPEVAKKLKKNQKPTP